MPKSKHHEKLSNARVARIVKAFSGRRLGVLGDWMLDRYVWGKATRLSPEAADMEAVVATLEDRVRVRVRRTDADRGEIDLRTTCGFHSEPAGVLVDVTQLQGQGILPETKVSPYTLQAKLAVDLLKTLAPRKEFFDLRLLLESSAVNPDNLKELVAQDPLTYTAPQMRLL